MAREKKPPSKPNMGYLVSFGDTMTALLAFFIVLNSLAKEQTGANMYAGTSSFSAAFKDLASPGGRTTARSSQVVSLASPSPLYCLNESGKQAADPGETIGPDDTDDNERIIDRQNDNFKRFLNELDHQFELKKAPTLGNQVVFDCFQPASAEDLLLDENSVRLAAQAMSMIRNNNYELEITVWASMPGELAMKKALRQTDSIRRQLNKLFTITPEQQTRIRFSSKCWLFSDAKRPSLSIAVSKRIVE